MIEITELSQGNQLDDARLLFTEYAESLGFDLCFQDFQTELGTLDKMYAPPKSAILLAYVDNRLAGCVAMRKFGDDICEMKRLYVRPEYRKLGIGRKLSEKIIELGRMAGYKIMRLDTLDTMIEAIALYESLGFKEIESYRYNPLDNAKYFELVL